MDQKETYRPAFTTPPGETLAGIPTKHLQLPSPYLSYGLPFSESCAKHVKETFRAERVYIICSGSLAKNTDNLDKLIHALGEDNVVGIRKGMTPHTLWSEILEIVHECRNGNVDCVVTLGAGTLTDAAKIVVLCLANNIHTPSQLSLLAIDTPCPPSTIHPPTIPLITIPTSLSGGEYFPLAGGTQDSNSHKRPFLHSDMGSKLVILDPSLCLTTPEYYWLSTGVRSMDHCVEALCSLSSTPASDQAAEMGLRLLVPNLLACKSDAADVEARYKCQLAVVHAMDTIRQGIPMGGSHAIGHQLGPLGVPHGITSCILLPAVQKYNLNHRTTHSISHRQHAVLSILWSEPRVSALLSAAHLSQPCTHLHDALDVIIRALGLPRSLRDVNVSPDVIPMLAERAVGDFWAPTNPVPLVDAVQVEEVLGMVV